MATAKELQARVEELEAEVAGLDASRTELNITVQTQEADITDLRSQLTTWKLRALDMPPVPPAPTPLGSLTSPSGLIVVLDAEVLESSWTDKRNAQHGYVVDVVGEHAAYLASRQSFKSAAIPGVPNGMRITTTNTIEANQTMEDIRRMIVREGWEDTVHEYSLGASYTMALDAARAGGGAGFAQKSALALAVLRVPKGAGVSVGVRDGKLVVG